MKPTLSPASRAHSDPWPLVYAELRRLAKRYLANEKADHTLQPTALVHEAYLRLGRGGEALWQNRSHFLRLAARAMRRILIDHARCRSARRRSGDWHRTPFESDQPDADREDDRLIALDESLDQLRHVDPRLARLVELRFFAGLSFAETASVMKISIITAKRRWKLAKGWLLREMSR